MFTAIESEGVSVFFRDEISQEDFIQKVENGAKGWFHGVWQREFISDSKVYLNHSSFYNVSPHGMLEPWALKYKAWKKKPYFHLIEKKFLNKAKVIFATGTLEEENLKKLLPSIQVETIPLGLNCSESSDYEKSRKRLAWASDEKVLLFLSRIHPKKGLLELLEALKRLEGSKDKIRLVIVGDGDSKYLEELKSFHDQYKENLPRVEFQGPVWGIEKWDYLKGADLFCLTTYSENFGLAVLEAAMVGTPVLTTEQTPWRIHKESSGFIIESSGVEGALRGLKKFLSSQTWSKDDRVRLSKDMKQQYSWSMLAPKYVKIFK